VTWDRCLPRRPTPGSVLCKPDMLCTYVVGDTSDCGSSGVGAPQGALSPVWTGQSGLERVVHYSNLPVCTTRLVSSHHAVTPGRCPVAFAEAITEFRGTNDPHRATGGVRGGAEEGIRASRLSTMPVISASTAMLRARSLHLLLFFSWSDSYSGSAGLALAPPASSGATDHARLRICSSRASPCGVLSGKFSPVSDRAG
jgi:hypothetical protein